MMLTIFACFVFLSFSAQAKKPELFEGDIILDDNTRKIVNGANAFDAVASVAKKWPGGVVPYVFHSYFDNSRRNLVKQAIQDFNDKTCVRFQPRTTQSKYVRFVVGQGCSSQIGVSGGVQDISIGNGCENKGTVIHEMMHAIGFWHEQSRLDRDQYVTIYWNNIQSGMGYNFQTYQAHEASYYGEPYDFDSVMHYHKTAFSSNGYATIVAKSDPNRKLGQRVGFSDIDIRQINKLYSCSGGTGGGGGGGGSCADNHGNCAAWASSGECQKNPDWMLVNCKKSCNACSSSQCVDNDSNCSYWASIGECSKNPNYMLVHCKKSCNKC